MNKILLLFCGLFTTTTMVNAQAAKTIKLKNLPAVHSPKEFYISAIADDRADTTNIGTMKAGLTGKLTTITLQGGPAAGIMQYLNDNTRQDKSKLPVEIHLDRFEVKEEKDGGTPQVHLYSELSFNARGMHVYKIAAHNYIQGGYDVSAFIGKLIQQGLDYQLKTFDEWLAQNPISATGNNIEVDIEMMKTDNDANLIPYSKQRPLLRTDFQGRVDDLSHAAAVTLSGISFKYSWERLGGKTKVKIKLLPYFNKNLSWWRAKTNTPEILLHEQLHFDITAIYACQLKTKIEQAVLKADELEQQISGIVNDIEQERSAMQQQYDGETQHGINKAKQAEWQVKVKAMLAEQSCY